MVSKIAHSILNMMLHQYRVEQHNHFLWLASSAVPDAPQDVLGPPCHLPNSFLQSCPSAFRPPVCTYIQGCPFPGAESGTCSCKLHIVGDCSDLQFDKISLQGLFTLDRVKSFSLFSITYKLSAHLSLASRSFIKTLKRTGPWLKLCGTPLVTGIQPDVTPFTLTLLAGHSANCSPIALWFCLAVCWAFCSEGYWKKH